MRVAAVEHVSAWATLLRVDPGRPFPYRAGQAVLAGLATQDVRKPYSIAGAPAEARAAGVIDLLIGHDDSGALGPHLWPLAPGSVLGVSGPVGTFELPTRLAGRSLVFVAGGTGIAPLRAMIGDALGRARPPAVRLVYSARTPADLAFHAEFAALQQARRLAYFPTVTRDQGDAWRGRRGRIDAALLAGVVLPSSVCLVCGSMAFNAGMTAVLADLGVPASRTLTEQY